MTGACTHPLPLSEKQSSNLLPPQSFPCEEASGTHSTRCPRSQPKRLTPHSVGAQDPRGPPTEQPSSSSFSQRGPPSFPSPPSCKGLGGAVIAG